MYASFGAYCFVFPWALLLLSLDWMPFGMEWMSSLLLAALGLASIGWLWANYGKRGLVLGVAIFAVGLALEYTGVLTGFPFGSYRYTDVLTPQLPGSVPVAIGFAWLMIVVCGLFTARWLLPPKYASNASVLLISALGALLAVGLDLLLEPVAYLVKHYWVWQGGGQFYYGIPLANFIAWLVFAFVLNLVLSLLLGLKAAPRWAWLPLALFGMNVVLFTVVNLAHSYWISSLVGAALLAIIGTGVLRRRSLPASD